MDISRFYPGALLDEPTKPATHQQAPPQQQSQTEGEKTPQNVSGMNQNMLMSLLPALMGGGDISSVLSSMVGTNGLGAGANAGMDGNNAMIQTLTTLLKNKSPASSGQNQKQKTPAQYQEADDYIFD